MRVTPPRVFRLSIVCAAVLMVMGAVPVGAAERTVPSPNYPTIQSAIDACVDGDEVVVQPGRYTGDGNRDLDFAGRSITVRSTDPNNWTVVSATVIDCDGTEDDPHLGFYFHTGEDANAVVAGVTITRGYAQVGGGIRCDEGVGPTITKCAITWCWAGMGGGIVCLAGTTEITHCIIRNNAAMMWGGGVLAGSGTRIINCVICENVTEDHGSAPLGAAGGGICSMGATITNCTLWDNCARSAQGHGIYAFFSATVTNSIVWCKPKHSLNTIEGDATITYSNIEGGYAGEGNIDVDPGFVSLDGDFHLGPNSPCIDAGTNSPPDGLPATDREGLARCVDGDGDGTAVVDMGAHERIAGGPLIAAQPLAVDLCAHVGGGDPEDRSLTVLNAGDGTLAWTVDGGCSWLTVSPRSGESQGAPTTVTLSVDATGLPIGDYACPLEIVDAGACNGPVGVYVRLHVRPIRRVPSEYATIQAAIDSADDYDLILVADGTHTGLGNRDVQVLDKTVIVRSENGADQCIIDCEGEGQAFYLEGHQCDASVLEGLTVTGGSASFGGAIACCDATPTIRGCKFVGNEASWSGGAISCSGHRGCLRISNCTISGNRGDDGGAIFTWGFCRLVIENSLITDNSADYYGGGAYHDRSQPIYANCTFAGNRAYYMGGAISLVDQASADLRGCVVWGNTTSQGAQVELLWYSVAVRYSDVEGGPNAVYRYDPVSAKLLWGEGNIDADPCFVDPDGADNDPNTWQDNDYHLRANSPCRNAGDPNGDYRGQTDVDGEARVMGPGVDMGADEVTYGRFLCGSLDPLVPALGVVVLLAVAWSRRRD